MEKLSNVCIRRVTSVQRNRFSERIQMSSTNEVASARYTCANIVDGLPRRPIYIYLVAMTLAEFIAPGPANLRIHFPAEAISVDHGTMIKNGEAVGCVRTADRKAVVIVLNNTCACATVLVGAISTGQSLVSVPMPPRGANLEWYSQFIQRI